MIECKSYFLSDLKIEGVQWTILALFGGNRGNGTKCGLSCWNLNNLATNVNANIGASHSYLLWNI